MSVISRYRRRMSIGMILTFSALILALVFTLSSRALIFAAGEHLTQISSDPYTNPDSQHKTQVEPDSFAFGNTIVSAFQPDRYFNVRASNIGLWTATNNGDTWKHD